MLPLRIVETDRPDFEEPVVELWREDDFVGMIFWDGEEALVQIYPDHDGDVYDIEINDLLRVLDVAIRIVTPEEAIDDDGSYLPQYSAEPEGSWDNEHPATAALTGEFDAQVVFRTEDGEGFGNLDHGSDMIIMICRRRLIQNHFQTHGPVVLTGRVEGCAIDLPESSFELIQP